MRIFTLLFINIALLISTTGIAQLTLISNPDAGYGVINYSFAYGNNFYFLYGNASNRSQLAKYDGTNITLVPNPDGGGLTGYPVIYNGTLYWSGYQSVSGAYQLAKYDSTNNTLSLFGNPDGGNLSGSATEYNGNLYFQYQNSFGNYELAKFNGSNVSLIPNPDGGIGFVDVPTVYAGNLYSIYYNQNTGKDQLAKCNGSTVSLIPNPDLGTVEFDAELTVYNGNLYFGYQNVLNVNHLAKYDGNSISLISNPATPGVIDVAASIVYAGNLYFKCGAQLARYDGNAITLVTNPALGTIDNYFFLHGTGLFFPYQNASGNYQLAKYDGTSITLINNPDAGNGFYSYEIDYGSDLYFVYTNNSSIHQLAKYDNNTITLISNPVGGGSIADANPVVSRNKLYYVYVNASGTMQQLASVINSALPLTLTSFFAQRQNNNDVLITWQTQNEINVAGFSIERSKDAIHYVSVGRKNASNIAGSNNYSFTDNVSSITSGNVFYRLLTSDLDGKQSYSPVVKLNLDELIGFSISPNPTNGYLLIKGSVKQLKIFDISGKLIVNRQLYSGTSNTDISGLSKGIYIVEILDTSNHIHSQKIVVE